VHCFRLGSLTGKRYPVVGKRLHSEFPYIDAEVSLILTFVSGTTLSVVVSQVRYAVREYAATAVDVIARRTRLAFLNAQAAEESLPMIVDIMAEELKWSKAEKQVRADIQ